MPQQPRAEPAGELDTAPKLCPTNCERECTKVRGVQVLLMHKVFLVVFSQIPPTFEFHSSDPTLSCVNYGAPVTPRMKALSSAAEPCPKKPAPSRHSANLKRVVENENENETAKSSTTDADALWRKIPMAKPRKHPEAYCLDTDCEKHGRDSPSTGETRMHNLPRAKDTYPIQEATAPSAVPASTAKQS